MFKLNESSAIKLFGKTIPLLTLNQEEEALTDLELSFRRAGREDFCDRNLLSLSSTLDGVNSNDGYQAQAPREDQQGHQVLLLQQLQCEPAPSFLQKPSKILDCWGNHEERVPVGAGRRETKSSSALHYHYIMISDAIRAAQASAANGIHQNPFYENNNSRVLTFGSDSSIPVGSVFNVSGKTQINVQNGFHKPEQRIVFEDNHSGESLITASYSLEKEGKASLNQTEVGNCNASTSPTLCPPVFPVSFHPAPTYRNYSVPSPWDVPVATPSPSSVNQCAPSSSPTTPALGKHSRDENILSPANLEKEKPSGGSNRSEGGVLNSKTLRIDDPGETAKSSMLETLMIKSKKTNSINLGGLFNGFQSKSSDGRNYRLETFSVLRANPAALSRSLNFQENT
ncbi:hypothetical protein CRYUN_Cryun29cG0099000 [Craigia yunnanensis]